ncbi:hypothetical protein RRF57_006371 [Xylaria bambusicola]|uniref:Uncharacterized protein n=1 Tax=Xylaria bambusicola TaxID=326684 RepID=A0AAN7US09_9PEZI
MVSFKCLTLALALAIPMVSAMPAEEHHHSKHHGHHTSQSHRSSHHSSHHSSFYIIQDDNGYDYSNTSKFGSKTTYYSHSTRKPPITTRSSYASVSVHPSPDISSFPLTTADSLGATPTFQAEAVEETLDPVPGTVESPIIIPTGDISIMKGGGAAGIRGSSPIIPPKSGSNSGSSDRSSSNRGFSSSGSFGSSNSAHRYTSSPVDSPAGNIKEDQDLIFPLGGGLFHPSFHPAALAKANSVSANVVRAITVTLLLCTLYAKKYVLTAAVERGRVIWSVEGTST